MPFCITDAGNRRPFALHDLCGHPRFERSTGKQLMRLPGTDPIGPAHRITAPCTVDRGNALCLTVSRRSSFPTYVPAALWYTDGGP